MIYLTLPELMRVAERVLQGDVKACTGGIPAVDVVDAPLPTSG
jgi:hypothetical protein